MKHAFSEVEIKERRAKREKLLKIEKKIKEMKLKLSKDEQDFQEELEIEKELAKKVNKLYFVQNI